MFWVSGKPDRPDPQTEEHTMDATTATAFITSNKGMDVAVTLIDGTEIYGSALSVNSKGVNVKIDGKTRSVALSRIDSIELDTEDDTYGADDTADDDAAAAIIDGPEDTDDAATDDDDTLAHDGMTTRELAEILGTDPKSLRVVLRSLGLGVGKGRQYSLTVADMTNVRNALTA